MFDPFEYFVQRRKGWPAEAELRLRTRQGVLSHPLPLARAEHGQKTRELLESIPGTSVTTVERCAGHDGTWGVKTEHSPAR